MHRLAKILSRIYTRYKTYSFRVSFQDLSLKQLYTRGINKEEKGSQEMSSLFGWIASLCFFVCGVPQAVKCFKEKSAKGMSSGTLFFYLTGELSLMTSNLSMTEYNIPLLTSTAFNILCLLVVVRYKVFPVIQNKPELIRETIQTKNINDVEISAAA